MSKKITSPKIILFDCFETIVENDLNGWKSLFAEIIKKNHWNLDPLEFWNLWKKYEVNFREIRTNMEKIEESPPFITYEKAWKDCFDIVFNYISGCNPFGNYFRKFWSSNFSSKFVKIFYRIIKLP